LKRTYAESTLGNAFCRLIYCLLSNADATTNSGDLAFLPLKVIRTGAGGKRRLIQACLQPGVSISGMALKAGINANQLRKWILQSRKQASLPCVMLQCIHPCRRHDCRRVYPMA